MATERVRSRCRERLQRLQHHLKSVFEKTCVHSRRELLATFNATAD